MNISLNNLGSTLSALSASVSSIMTSKNITNLNDDKNKYNNLSNKDLSIVYDASTSAFVNTSNIRQYYFENSIKNNNNIVAHFNTNYILDYLAFTPVTNIVNIVMTASVIFFLESSGKVLSCGLNNGTSGWTGNKTSNGATYVPQYVLGTGGIGTQLQNIVNIACNNSSTIFLESSGKVLSCGLNNGAVGWTGHRTNAGATYYPQYVIGTLGALSQLQNIINISSNANVNMFLETSGKVLSCGLNDPSITYGGWTGNKTTNGPTYYPQYVLGTGGIGTELQNITRIIASGNSAVFLENTGRVLSCGRNDGTFGWTGNRTTNGSTFFPQYILGTSGVGSLLNNIINVSQSPYHTMFLENTGKVIACGLNNGTNGWTGHRTTIGATFFPQYVLGTSGLSSQLQNITSLSAIDTNSIFLENTGKVLSCGRNNGTDGWTGNRTTIGATYFPQYVLGTGGTGTQLQNITHVVSSLYNTMLLENTGKVLTYGLNNATDGWTGNQTTNGATFFPQYVLGTYGLSSQLQNITNIVIASNVILYLETTGKVLTCGLNNGTNGWAANRTTNAITYYPDYALLSTNSATTNININKTWINNFQTYQNIVQIECTWYSTLFLENTGKVLSLGLNNGTNGWTGHRTSAGLTYIPQYVLGTSGISTQIQNITNIAIANNLTLYLETSGKVLVCGRNNLGSTGHATTNDSTYIPQYVLGTSGTGTQLQNIINIYTSGNNTVFLENTGNVLSCGQNNGTLGWTGHITTDGTTFIPQYVLGTGGLGSKLENITNIVCGPYNTMFLEKSGKVLACGYNNGTNGWTGHATTDGATFIPQYVLSATGTGTQLQNISQIALDSTVTIFIENNGKVLTCGLNSGGSGRTGNKTSNGATFYPQYVLGTSGDGTELQNIKNAACAVHSTLFLESTGRVLSCGYQVDRGFTGNKTTNGATFYPQYVLGTDGTTASKLENITNILVTAFHDMLLENTGKVLGIGENDGTYGFTGHRTNAGRTFIPQYTILPQTNPNNVTSNITNSIDMNNITEGPNCYYAIVGSSCNVIANINNNYGKLGIQATLSSNLNINSYVFPNDLYDNYVVDFSGTGLLSNVYQIACGMYHTVFLTYDNKTYSCGNNQYGQLGIGSYFTMISVGKPVPMKTTVDIVNISRVACGLYHTCLLDTSGNVWTCGLNNYGQLGLANNTNTPTPTQISSIRIPSISDIQCGENHSVFKTTYAIVYATGLNNVGQLGVGDNTNKNIPTQVDGIDNIGILSNVKNIYCSRNCTFYTLTTDNIVYMSGSYKSTTINYPIQYAIFNTIITLFCNKFSDEAYVKTQ